MSNSIEVELVMKLSQPMDQRDMQSKSSSPTDSYAQNNEAFTIDCYRRRNEILSKANRAEWWMVAAVLLITASVGIAAL